MSGTRIVMISSTARDLDAHRRAALDACLRLKCAPRMMEYEPAADRDATELSMALVDEADVYVLVLGYSYGSVPPGGDKSYTELEYERATARGSHVIALLMSDQHPLTRDDVDTGPNAGRIETFRARVAADRVVGYFSSADDMRASLVAELGRAVAVTTGHRTPAGLREPVPPEAMRGHPYTLVRPASVVGRATELDDLRQWADGTLFQDSSVLTVSAIGGMGKSALAWKWFEDVAPQIPGVVGRMWWSFYDTDARFDTFLLHALAYVTGAPLGVISTFKVPERMDRLLDVLDRESFVVVLDGAERLLLAYARHDACYIRDDEVAAAADRAEAEVRGDRLGTGSWVGHDRLRTTIDPRVGEFLRRLPMLRASRVLITSRLYPRELQSRDGRPSPGSRLYTLGGLNDTDAQALWSASGCRADDARVKALLESFGNYPLLIRALAAEVATFRPAPGDLGRWSVANPGFDPFRGELLTDDDRRSHVLSYALKGLTDFEREVLRLIANFTTPVVYATLRALVTDPRNRMADEVDLDRALTGLEDRGLLGWDRSANRYDLHPVVRGVALAGLDRTAQWTVLNRLATHFGSAPEIDEKAVAEPDDLADRFELCHTLIRLNRISEAADLLNGLAPVGLRVGAFDELTALVETITQVSGGRLGTVHPDVSEDFALVLGVAALFRGDPTRAEAGLALLPDTGTVVNPATRTETATLHGLCLVDTGALAEAHRFARLGARSSSWCELLLGVIGARIDPDGDDVAWLHASTNATNDLYVGRASLELAWLAVRRGAYGEAEQHCAAVESLTATLGDVTSGVHVRLLRGALARRRLDRTGLAYDVLHEALVRAREFRLAEHEIVARIELAACHRDAGQLDEVLRELSEAEALAGRNRLRLRAADVAVARSEAELAFDDREAAALSAVRAFRLAWCDGGEHSYRTALESARDCLEATGTQPPADLPTRHIVLPALTRRPPVERKS